MNSFRNRDFLLLVALQFFFLCSEEVTGEKRRWKYDRREFLSKFVRVTVSHFRGVVFFHPVSVFAKN